MVDRILISANAIKVSKPGHNVNSAAAQDLSWDGTGLGLGVYMSGTAIIAAYSHVDIVYPQNLGYVPFVLAQWKVDNSTAWGGGSAYHVYHEPELPDDNQQQVDAEHISYPMPENCKGIIVSPSFDRMQIRSEDVQNSLTVKYVIFYTEAGTASSVPGAADRTPDVVNWHSITGNGITLSTNQETITGIAEQITIGLTASSVLPANTVLEVIKNGSVVATMVSGQSTLTFTVQNSDTLLFRKNGSGSMSDMTVIVRNVSTNTDLDSFGIDTTNFADTTPNQFTFNDVTNAGLDSWYESNTITVTGVDTGTILSIIGGEYMLNNDSYWRTENFYVYQGTTVRIRLKSSVSYGTSVTSQLTIGGVSDTWTVSTSAPSALDGSITVGQQAVTQTGGTSYWRYITYPVTATITSGGSGSYTYSWSIHTALYYNAYILDGTLQTCRARTEQYYFSGSGGGGLETPPEPPPDTQYDEVVLKCIVTDTVTGLSATLFSSTIIFME